MRARWRPATSERQFATKQSYLESSNLPEGPSFLRIDEALHRRSLERMANPGVCYQLLQLVEPQWVIEPAEFRRKLHEPTRIRMRQGNEFIFAGRKFAPGEMAGPLGPGTDVFWRNRKSSQRKPRQHEVSIKGIAQKDLAVRANRL